MIEREYLVGYKEALEVISKYITQASKRYPNNTLAVLNDVIAKLHQELADKRIALRDLDEFTTILDEKEIEEVIKVMNDLIATTNKPIIFTVEKIEKGGRLL